MTTPSVLRPAAGDLPLDEAMVMRYLGYRPGVTRVTGRETGLVAEGIRLAKEAARPAASFLMNQEIIIHGDRVITRLPGLHWQSHTLAVLLRKATDVTLVAATLGPGVDELTSQLFAADEFALATVVDAAGTALVHALSLHLAGELRAERPGCVLTPLYGPGYGDWPIEDQRAIADAVGSFAIGLTITASHYLTPQKSLVGLMGWLTGSDSGRAAGCAVCARRECGYRA